MSPSPDVAVIGSGPAGLAASFRLQQAGHRVRIFEANDYVGGKTKTTRRDGFAFDEGAAVLAKSYQNVFALAAEAGIADQIIPAGAVLAFVRDGQIHYLDGDHPLRDGLRMKLVSPGSKLVLTKLVLDVLRARRFLDYEDLSKAAKLDTESAAGYAARRLNPEISDYVVDLAVRGLVGGRADDISKLDFFFCLSKWFGVRFSSFRDGMGSYAELLSRRFDVQLQSRAVAVEQVGDGVRVVYRDPNGVERTEDVAGCVVAVAAPFTADLLPQLDPWRRQFLRGIPYSKMVNISVAQSQPIAGQRASMVLVPRPVDPKVLGVFLPHNLAPGRVPQGKGMVQVYSTTEGALELIDEDDDFVVKSLLDSAERVLPGSSANIEWAHVSRWDPLVVVHPPGYTKDLSEFHRLCREQDRTIQLAGDYWSVSNLNSATASGERAGRALVAALGGGRRGGRGR